MGTGDWVGGMTADDYGMIDYDHIYDHRIIDDICGTKFQRTDNTIVAYSRIRP
jgi:hypothetical protein